MKNFLRIFALAICVFFGTTSADDFKSQFIATNTDCGSCPIHVDDEQFLLIRNFTQDGGNDRGYVTFMRHGAPNPPVTVLTASIVDPTAPPGGLEVINSIVISGPAMVNVHCGDDAPTGCFFSYKKEGN